MEAQLVIERPAGYAGAAQQSIKSGSGLDSVPNRDLAWKLECDKAPRTQDADELSYVSCLGVRGWYVLQHKKTDHQIKAVCVE
jgi:hypothetical protein